MKKVLLLSPVLFAILLLGNACGQTQPAKTAADGHEDQSRRVEVSRNGFDSTAAGFRLEVESGHEAEITFVYGDSDFPQNNPHIIAIPELGITTQVLDQGNQEITVRFATDKTGEFSFMCVIADCVGHANLVGGTIVIGE